MTLDKRIEFLQAFLSALGAFKIKWDKINEDSISGTVIYNENDTNETQEFIWKTREESVPTPETLELIKYLELNNLLAGDKISIPINEINIPNINDSKKYELFNELFQISVDMIDDGEETYFYFIHE